MRKRTWHFIYNPDEYEIRCDKCKGRNIAWSEFEHRIWCYDCNIDTEGDGGIFDGPISWEATKILIGPYAFHKWDLKRKCLLEPYYPRHTKRIFWRKMKNPPKIQWAKNKPA